MYTECPSCKTIFKITPAQLKAARGKVRCGSCNHIFNGLEALTEAPPATQFVSQPISEPTEVGEQDNSDTSSITNPLEDSKTSPAEEIFEATNDVIESKSSDLISEAEPDLEPLRVESTAESNMYDPGSSLSEFAKQIEEDEHKADDQPISFADVDVPGTEELPNNKNTVAEEAPVPVQAAGIDDITKDINAALDNLFEDDELVPKDIPESPVDKSVADDLPIPEFLMEEVEEPKVKELTLEDLDKSPSLELDETVPAVSKKTKKVKKQKKPKPVDNFNPETEFSVDEFSESFSESDVLPNHRSQQIEKLDLEDELISDTTFDLDDPLLNTQTVEMGEDEWSEPKDVKPHKDIYAGESFVLEELQEDNLQSNGAVSRVIWLMVIVVLLVTVVGLFTYNKRNMLAENPTFRPLIEKFCGFVGQFYSCEIEQLKDTKAIVLLERNVVGHPNAENALLITSTIESRTDFVQPYPDLILTFSDLNQKVIARRTFKPKEYLSKEVKIEDGFKPKTPIKVMLEIVDPGESAVNFEFDFR